MKPRIGLTPTTTMLEDRLVDTVNRAFVTAVTRAGGVPFLLPVLDPPDAAFALPALDGLLLTGGGDVDPMYYGAVPVAEVYGVDRDRDLFEMALVAEALAAGIPVLGICRGTQLLNVALGGTLVQHLPAVTGQAHSVNDRWAETVHSVEVMEGTALAGITGPGEVAVNSLHHQAVDQLGFGLRVSARAGDGIVEAVESNGAARLLGVQWHPELLPGDPAHDALFEWLVRQAGGSPVGAGETAAAVADASV